MKLSSIGLALALLSGSSAMAATCTTTFSLGTLGYADSREIGNSFSSVQSFNDCYQFTLTSSPSNALGVTLEWDFLGMKYLDITLASATLSGGGMSTALVDLSPQEFKFTDLQSGTYELSLAGTVTKSEYGFLPGSVEYIGRLGIAPPVPEPETLAMLALGFGLVTWTARRKKI